MEIYYGVDAFRSPRRPVLLALGMFDGVHLGHQHLISRLKERAGEVGGFSVVTTFDPHPVKILAPPLEPFLLTTLEERIALLERLGINAVLVFPFNEAFRQISAEAFIGEILLGRLEAREVFTGPYHTFGKDRRGNVDLLRRKGEEMGFQVHVLEPFSLEGDLISSSLIRSLLRRGEVEQAAKFLGRWYSLKGSVVPGGRRGVELGFPTANLSIPEDKLLPANGVYAGFAHASGERFLAVMNVGVRPTFGGRHLVVEAHLLDFRGGLYGEVVELEFAKRLRDEQRFSDPQSLSRQIEQDIASARRALG